MQLESSGTGAEARPGVRQILSALGAALVGSGPDRNLAAVFEQQVQQVLSMRTVRLREVPARYHARLVTPTRTADSIVLGVPTADPRVQAVFEASCEPGRSISESEFEMLASVACLGGLVLEASRSQVVQRPRSQDGAAPLIGSTRVMQSLRERVERVAMTDFTVLIEGASGRQQNMTNLRLETRGVSRVSSAVSALEYERYAL
jgi:hypothetical protein